MDEVIQVKTSKQLRDYMILLLRIGQKTQFSRAFIYMFENKFHFVVYVSFEFNHYVFLKVEYPHKITSEPSVFVLDGQKVKQFLAQLKKCNKEDAVLEISGSEKSDFSNSEYNLRVIGRRGRSSELVISVEKVTVAVTVSGGSMCVVEEDHLFSTDIENIIGFYSLKERLKTDRTQRREKVLHYSFYRGVWLSFFEILGALKLEKRGYEYEYRSTVTMTEEGIMYAMYETRRDYMMINDDANVAKWKEGELTRFKVLKVSDAFIHKGSPEIGQKFVGDWQFIESIRPFTSLMKKVSKNSGAKIEFTVFSSASDKYLHYFELIDQNMVFSTEICVLSLMTEPISTVADIAGFTDFSDVYKRYATDYVAYFKITDSKRLR